MTRTATSIGFDDKDTLRDIRTLTLNPLAEKVERQIAPDLNKAKNDILLSHKEVSLTNATKTLVFTKHDGKTTSINLTPIIPNEFKGINVSGNTGSSTDVINLAFEDGSVTKTSGITTVTYDWNDIVPNHQEKLIVKQDGSTTIYRPETLTFKGSGVTVSQTTPGVTVVEVDDPTAPLIGKIGTGADTTITKIAIAGKWQDSDITDGTMTIHLPDGGGPAGVGGNFQGFFETEGDLISSVTSPINGKSYAYVRDAKFKGKYYTPYMYVSGKWTEAPVDPALSYDEPDVAEPQGVFSIKPNSKIKVDKLGQLDLDGLADGNFHGFYETEDDMKAAIKNPIVDRSAAYVRLATGGFSLYQYKMTGSQVLGWVRVVPYGMSSVVKKNEAGTIVSAQPVYGFLENNGLRIDDGLVVLKEPEKQSVTVTAAEKAPAGGSGSGTEKTTQVDRLHFVGGIYVDTTTEPGTARIHHPQKVIHYNAAFEEEHKTSNYLGHIFYDDNAKAWMGWSEGLDGFDVTPKWTRVIHRGMSDEVKGTTLRLPIKAPKVTPGTLGDNRQWEHTGWSYVESATDAGFSSDYQNKGLYIQTYCREFQGDAPHDRPSKRMQIAFIEETDSSETEIFVRIQDSGAGQTDPFWKPWFKASVSQKDLNSHRLDPAAHASTIKFHKVASLIGKFDDIRKYNGGSGEGGLINGLYSSLLADNYGHTDVGDSIMKAPYRGEFRISGNLALSGYNDSIANYPEGTWRILIRKKVGTGNYTEVVNASYKHTSPSKPYPLLSFMIEDIEMEAEEALYVHITFDKADDLINRHPFVYFVPVRSNIVMEDMNTSAGANIAKSFRTLYGNVDVFGDVGFRVHRRSYDSGTIRSYGVVVDKTPVVMEQS